MEEQGYFALVIGAILVNNFVLSRFLGICPFLGVSKKLGPALGMCGAVLFVLTMASAVTSALNRLVLVKDARFLAVDISYLHIIVFILVIASLVQLVELTLQRFSEPLYKALGIYLPLITTNCAVLGAALICRQENYSVLKSTVFGAASAVGFAVALIMFASIREKLDLAKVPECMEGTAIALVTAGILAMAFMGFSGLGG
jgi:electron transport complex protein RnfA